jgi:hypothetical protein
MAVAALLSLAWLASTPGTKCFGNFLQMGLDGVGWEANNATGPLLYRDVPEAQLVSVRARISTQTAGNWSQAGLIARVPSTGAGENWQASWSFRAPAAGPFQHQSNQSLGGVETELNDAGLTAANLTYIRLDNMGGGVFQAYRGSGPDDDNITWTPQMDANMMPQPQTNANLVGQTLQVGLAGGAIGALANANVRFDWVEIQTTGQTFRDDFNYTRDLGTDGVLPGGIWTGIVNGTVGGFNSRVGPNVGRCLTCTWNVNGSANFNAVGSWMGETPGLAFAPGGNDTAVVLGAALVASPATVYTNQSNTLKRIDFDNAGTYVLGGPGSFTLDADTGNAAINVLQGSHEIQADLILNDNVTATAATGTTLNINAPVFLNGHTWTSSGAGTINCNNSPSCLVGNGSSSLVNDANLTGLASFAGDFTQTGNGRLAVQVGGGVIDVSGAAELAGTLEVSLADGFVPAPGASYTVLTAGSVTDLGLTLAGSAAGAFQLAVGPTSVSLVAGAIPEPSTAALASLWAVALAALARTRRRITSRSASLLAAGGLLATCTATARADVLTFGTGSDPNAPVTYRDEFDTFFDYANGGGAVPAGTLITSTPGATNKSWTSIHNPLGGGAPGTPPVLQANGMAFNGTPKPGVLYIEDLVLQPNTTAGTLGMGWEGNKTNGPLLHANVRAEDSFDAVIKINAQTAGNWSYTNIIARRAGPGVGRTVGDMLEPTERFVTMGSFRAAADDPGTPANEALNANLLTQNVLEVDNTDPTPEEQEVNTGGANATTGLPLWVRMTKSGGQFTSATSLDGVNWTTRNSVFNTDLNITGQMLEVGPSFTLHNNAPIAPGDTDIDFFEITVRKTQRPLDATWAPGAANASGNWNTVANWTSMTLAQVPDANSTDVAFTTANQTSGPATIFTNRGTPNIVRSLTFDSANKYAISGAGSITLEPDPQSLIDTDQTYINVLNGSHEIQVDVSLSAAAASDNKITVADGAQLDINNTFNINGKQLRIEGAGRVNFNNNIDTGTSGTVIIAGGNLGGSGRINAAVQNGNATTPGGTISPGASTGTLTIDGNFTPHSSARLAIELGGKNAGQFDVLQVLGVANLAGTVDVSLVDGFLPTIGDMFTIITTTTGLGNQGNIALDPADTPFYQLMVNAGPAGTAMLKVINVPTVGLTGDFNNNGIVDAADYVLWRNGGPLMNEGGVTPGTSTPEDYTTWRANFGKASAGGGASLAANVPEPASALLVMLALSAAGSLWRQRHA